MIQHIDYDINKSLLLQEYNDIEQHMSQFSKLNPSWKKTGEVGQYGTRCVKRFSQELSGRVRGGYYLQKAGTSILPHRDSKCKCRINIKLTDDDGVMTIGGSPQNYDFALIDVNQYEHFVSQCTTSRLLFSIIYIDDTYEDVKEKLPLCKTKDLHSDTFRL